MEERVEFFVTPNKQTKRTSIEITDVGGRTVTVKVSKEVLEKLIAGGQEVLKFWNTPAEPWSEK
ncbi:hypothetical protein [Streptomyces sp. NPDC006477]|uniref:hypothetical protein n=1 Tax=Streptomyces sp. NPDC006477 TaxID=3364747 RepID=UPI00368D9E42